MISRRTVGTLAAVVAVAMFIAVLVITVGAGLPNVDGLARKAPARTALMRDREAAARRAGRPAGVQQYWVSYERISPLLRRAVLIAEDDAFFSHEGLDWNEIKASARKNMEKHRVVRGGSTITQQLAKNLYLGDERTVTRKLKEMLLAIRLERALTKRRIFELYLNLIEWGDGVYGAEAAARRYFGVATSDLDPRQAALLAAVIINPRRYSPVEPNRRIENRARIILSRMARRGWITPQQHASARGEHPPGGGPLDWLWGPPEPPREPEPATPPEPESLGEEEPAAEDTTAG